MTSIEYLLQREFTLSIKTNILQSGCHSRSIHQIDRNYVLYITYNNYEFFRPYEVLRWIHSWSLMSISRRTECYPPVNDQRETRPMGDLEKHQEVEAGKKSIIEHVGMGQQSLLVGGRYPAKFPHYGTDNEESSS